MSTYVNTLPFVLSRKTTKEWGYKSDFYFLLSLFFPFPFFSNPCVLTSPFLFPLSLIPSAHAAKLSHFFHPTFTPHLDSQAPSSALPCRAVQGTCSLIVVPEQRTIFSHTHSLNTFTWLHPPEVFSVLFFHHLSYLCFFSTGQSRSSLVPPFFLLSFCLTFCLNGQATSRVARKTVPQWNSKRPWPITPSWLSVHDPRWSLKQSACLAHQQCPPCLLGPAPQKHQPLLSNRPCTLGLTVRERHAAHTRHAKTTHTQVSAAVPSQATTPSTNLSVRKKWWR